jgi:hypothetical protein
MEVHKEFISFKEKALATRLGEEVEVAPLRRLRHRALIQFLISAALLWVRLTLY